MNDPLFPAATTAAIAAAHTGPETVLTVPGSAHALALLRGPDAARVQAASVPGPGAAVTAAYAGTMARTAD